MKFFTGITKTDIEPLRIITLSAAVGATKNLTVYEYGNDIIVVDCGIGIPDSEMLGVDVVLPDITYLLEHKEKVRGIFITHGHEDHFGAIPYIIHELNVPIYSSKLVQGFLRERLKDKAKKGFVENVSMHLITPETEEITVGNFRVSAFRVNHSVPSSMGFVIRTSQGTVLHVADFKMDWTPVLDRPIDLGKIAILGDEGVLCLLSDCLGVTTEGFAKSERTLNETFNKFFESAQGRQIFVTTISSNISRMYQIINSAIKCGRKVVFAGRSITQSSNVGRELGYLPFDSSVFVDEKDASEYESGALVHIIAGCYGQAGSALDRLSRGEHRNLEIEDNALVIFSADPSPPGVQEAVERLLHNLTLRGAEVIYSEIQENLHVSGHGLKGDLTTVAALSKAKYFIPIGGTAAKKRAYSYMIQDLGIERERVFELLEGDSVVFSNGQAEKGESISVKQVYVDGSGIGEIGPIVMKDREHLSSDGVFVVVIPLSKDKREISGKIEVITRGFVYVKESKALIGRATDVVYKTLDKNRDKMDDWNFIRSRVERELERFLFKETGRNPLIIVSSISI